MIDFSNILFSDAQVTDVRIYRASVEVDYADWEEKSHTLVFENAVSCFVLSAYGKALSHGQVETEGDYLQECCRVAEEDSTENFLVFNFIEAWNNEKIIRIVARGISLGKSSTQAPRAILQETHVTRVN